MLRQTDGGGGGGGGGGREVGGGQPRETVLQRRERERNGIRENERHAQRE